MNIPFDWPTLGTYALVFSAVIAIFVPLARWMQHANEGARGKERGYADLPPLFRLLWGPATMVENTLGLVLSDLMPERRHKYATDIPASSLPLTPERIFAVQFCALVLGLTFGLTVFFIPGLSSYLACASFLFCGFLGWLLPALSFSNLVQRRRERLTKDLPFAIDLMASAMRAGLDFGAAMRYFTGLHVGGPIDREFGQVLQDVSLGKPFTDSLHSMADRLRIEAFTSFVGVVSYGADIGASIALTLKIHGTDLRRARFALAERKAARAPTLMIFPLVLFILPAVFIIIITPVIMQFKATGLGG